MKQKIKVSALVTCLLAMVSFNLNAQSEGESARSYTLPNFTVEGVADPELTHYVTPRIPSYLVGTNVTMYYTINKEGDVQSIRSNAGFASGELATMVSQALRSWHFEPAKNDAGEAVAIKVAMPVRVVGRGESNNAYASIDVKDFKLVALLD